MVSQHFPVELQQTGRNIMHQGKTVKELLVYFIIIFSLQLMLKKTEFFLSVSFNWICRMSVCAWNIFFFPHTPPHTNSFLFLFPVFQFLSQPLRNVNRCWLRFQSARRVMGQRNNWREHLFSARLGNWIPIPNRTRVKNKAPLSAAFSFVAAEDRHEIFFIRF